MNFFTEITDGWALLVVGGVYTQAPLYRRGQLIYAKKGGGFVRLCPNRTTTHAKTSWVEADLGPDHQMVTEGGQIRIADGGQLRAVE